MKLSANCNHQILSVLLIMALLLVTLPTSMSLAEAASEDGGIELQSKAGYQGMYKDSTWNPVQLFLTNRTSRTLKGDVVLSFKSPNNQAIEFVQAVELPVGTEINVTFGLPPGQLNEHTNQIRFYEGGFSSNKKTIPIIGADYVISNAISSYTIGVVSRDPDTLNFMPSLNQKGYDIKVIPLSPEDLPSEAILLDSLDTLVINDIGTGNWKDESIAAIRQWVVQGGTLVLSGGASYQMTAEGFQELSPVKAEGTLEWSNLDLLEQLSGSEDRLNKPVIVSTGEITAGSTTFGDGDLPLAVSRDLGSGAVIYVSFDPSLEPLSSWSGSAMFWARVLQKNLSSSQVNVNMNGNGYDQLYWSMSNIIDQFPSIKPPAFSILLLLFALYILIVAPLMYVVLKKMDRRAWAWWMIPLMSIAMGMLIFYIGAGNKRNVSTHSIEVIEAYSDGNAILTGGSGIFVPTGGKVEADFGKKRPMRLYSENVMNNSSSFDGNYQIESSADVDKALWNAVPYWSTRKMWLEPIVADSSAIGTLAVSYSDENGKTMLNVTNQTHMALNHVSLIYNNAVTPIGDLAIGDSMSIEKPPAASSGFMGYSSYSYSIFPRMNNNGADEWRRQRELIDNYINRNYNGNGVESMAPVVIGFSSDHDSLYEVNGKEANSDHLTMWVQKLDPIERIGNRVIVSGDVIKPLVVSSTMKSNTAIGNGSFNVGQGELVLEYGVPNAFDVHYDKLHMQLINNPSLIWSIWNEEAGQWEPLPSSLESDADPYLINGQSIRIKLEASMNTTLFYPQVILEGEVLS